MKRLVGLIALFIGVAPAPLSAFPDGAPWGSADPEGAQSCASCHYAEDAVLNSDAILAGGGLPSEIERGKTYSLSLSLVHTDYATIGFLIAASHGTFLSANDDKIDVLDNMARSTKPKGAGNETIYWPLDWVAPLDLNAGEIVTFNIAINASNDDASPFGDVIHYRKIQVTAK